MNSRSQGSSLRARGGGRDGPHALIGGTAPRMRDRRLRCGTGMPSDGGNGADGGGGAAGPGTRMRRTTAGTRRRGKVGPERHGQSRISAVGGAGLARTAGRTAKGRRTWRTSVARTGCSAAGVGGGAAGGAGTITDHGRAARRSMRTGTLRRNRTGGGATRTGGGAKTWSCWARAGRRLTRCDRLCRVGGTATCAAAGVGRTGCQVHIR